MKLPATLTRLIALVAATGIADTAGHGICRGQPAIF